MKIVIIADKRQEEEIREKNINSETEIIFVQEDSLYENADKCEALIYLKDDFGSLDKEKLSTKIVFVNSVIETAEQNKFPVNFYRINGWPGFLKRPVWEVASTTTTQALKIFTQPGWKMISVKDEPGLVSAKIISMIINEACFALGENVSTEEDINNAMKLGTSYPYGPFEWMDIIGIENIYKLLQKLSQKDKRYFTAPLLEKKYFEITHSK